MEPGQKKITVTEHLYYKGIGSFKYRGDFDNTLSETQLNDYFRLSSFYDLEIHQDLSVIEASEFDKLKEKTNCLEIEQLQGDFKVHHNDEHFVLEADKLYFLFDKEKEHFQIEDDQIHGNFNHAIILFKLHREVEKIVCIEGYSTGETKTVDGVEYKEVYKSDCTKEWVLSKTCKQGQKTGKVKEEEHKIYTEFYNENCTTYWEQTGCKDNYKTGETRIKNGIEEYEVYQSDCSTKWVRKKKNPPDSKGSTDRYPNGCWEILGIILMVLIGLFYLSVIISFISWQGFLILLALVGFVVGVYYLINYFDRKPKLVKRAGNIITLLFYAFLVFVFIMLLSHVFSTSCKREKSRSVSIENSRNKDKNDNIKIEKIPPKTEFEKDENDNESTSDDYFYRITVNWTDFKKNDYEGVYLLSNNVHEKSKSNIKSLQRNTSINNISQVYQSVYNNDKKGLKSFYTMLDSVKTANKLNKKQFAELIVSLVQEQQYTIVIDADCSNPSIKSNQAIRELLNHGFECESYHSFGLKTPLEFSKDLKGDCDTRTVLLYTILKHFDYKVAIINSDYYKHSMLGINLPNINGSYKLHRGIKYYFWETTAKGPRLGLLPREFKNTHYWNVVLN